LQLQINTVRSLFEQNRTNRNDYHHILPAVPAHALIQSVVRSSIRLYPSKYASLGTPNTTCNNDIWTRLVSGSAPCIRSYPPSAPHLSPTGTARPPSSGCWQQIAPPCAAVLIHRLHESDVCQSTWDHLQ